MKNVTQDELETLPHRARVAFAVRAGMRVQGLFTFSWKDAPDEYVVAISNALNLAAISARAGKRAAVRAPALVVDAVARAAAGRNSAPSARAAAAAVRAAGTRLAATRGARNTAKAAQRAANHVGCGRQLRAAQRFDFELLNQLAEMLEWDDDTPVPPEICGPLWPEGVPEKWPIDVPELPVGGSGEFLDLTFDLPADVDDETAAQLIRDLYEQLNRYYIAHGGSGLVVDNWQSFMPQHAEVLSS